MSLQVWLPLNGNLNNQGLSEVTVTNGGATVDSNGKIGNCYLVNSDKKISFSSYPWMTMKPQYSFSCFFWVKGTTSGWLIACGAWEFRLRPDFIQVHPGPSGEYAARYTDAFDTDTWYHLGFTWSGTEGKLRLYLDGNLVATSGVPSSTSHDITSSFGIPYDGPRYINDFRLYNHCLSAKEVKEISKGLICHYKLDNNGFGNSNLCNPSLGEFTGVVPTSSYENFLERIAITTANANDIYMLSYYAKASIDNITLTNHLYNNASNIVQVSYSVNSDGYTSARSDGYSLIRLTTSYKKYWVKWVFDSASTSATKDLLFRLQSELNTSSAGATVTIKNVKLEKGSVATPWCPHTSDSLYTSLGLDSTTESDCSGLSNNGTKIGGLTPSTSPTSIRYESCYDFDGNTGSIQIPNLAKLAPSGEFTMNCWIYHDNTWSSKGYETIFGGPSGFELDAKPASTNSPSLYVYNWGGGQATYELNKWNMITMTRSSSETKFYINGELKITGSAGTIPSGNYFIGAWNTSSQQNFKGKISDFRLYSTVLSADDIRMLYDTSASVDKSGNMYAYEFKEE